MKLQVHSIEADVVFLRLEGTITPGAAGLVQDPLEQLIGPKGYTRTIVLDLQHSDWIDSSGLAWLLSWDRKTREAGGIFGLCAIPPRVAEVLRITRMDQVLKCWPDEAAARAALAAQPKP
jgi:anti-sigma B factor antagonist